MHQQTIDGLREFAQNGGGHYFLTPAEVGDILGYIDNFAILLARRDTADCEFKQLFDAAYCEERLRIIGENKKGQRVISVTELIEDANPIIPVSPSPLQPRF